MLAGSRYGTRDSGLQTICARIRDTRPIVLASIATAGPTHQGFPFLQATARLSRDPESGPSSSSGAPGRHLLHRPVIARVRKTTRPGPRHCTPASVNGAVELGAKVRDSVARSSTVVTCPLVTASASGARLGATRRAAMMKRRRRIRARVAFQLFAHKGGKPSVYRILTPVRSRCLRGFLLLTLILVALAAPVGAGGQDNERRVLAVHLDNDINPVTQEYVENEVDRGEDEDVAAVVLVLDTPGGLASSMRGIVKRFLASTVPVIVYVAPPGSSADSAGAVIAMAADVAAMAPQTNIGS